VTTEPRTKAVNPAADEPVSKSVTEVDGQPRGVDRRVLLAGTGVGAAVLLAACSSGGSSSGSSDTGSTSSGSSGGSGSGTALATLSSIQVGSAVSAQDSQGNPIIVARPATDTAVAFSAICTHQGCTVAPAGSELDCPCHGSRYSATTGKVLGGPAPKPLPSIPVTVRGGQVFQS
jgi:Rieske Fe-S protein